MIFILTLITFHYIFNLFFVRFMQNNDFIKILIICSCIFLIRYIYIYPYKQRRTLSALRKFKYESHLKYKIDDHNELDISVSILFIYILFFILLLLFSRFNNVNRTLNITIYLKYVDILFLNYNIFSIIINMCLIMFGFIIYILLLSLFTKYIKKHLMKIYFFHLLDLTNKYEFHILSVILKIRYDRFTTKFIDQLLFKKSPNKVQFAINQLIYSHLTALEFIIHRLILIITIIYDIKYNNMVLSHMFKILPYVFIYELWVKLYSFLININLEYDKIIAKLLYYEVTINDIDNECLYLNGEPYEKKVIKEILTIYVRRGFVDKQFMSQDCLNNIINFWKNIIIKPIITKLSTYKAIDILCFLALVILLCR